MESILVSNQQNPFPAWVMASFKVVLTKEPGGGGGGGTLVCGWNAAGCPLKWNLFACTLNSYAATVDSR